MLKKAKAFSAEEKKKGKVDLTVTLLSLGAVVLISLYVSIWPDHALQTTGAINRVLTQDFGFYYIWFGVASLGFCLWAALSKTGSIKMGEADEKPQFSNFSWFSMLFCAGVGSGVIYWGFIEWAYYYSAPPLGAQPGSIEAAALAAAYPSFHWGVVGWAIYAVTSCIFGYLIFVRGGKVQKISEACRPCIGKHADGLVGKLIDISFIFGLIGGIATSLGLGTPLISAALCHVFGLQDSVGLQIGILAVICVIFGTSAYLGMDAGIKNLSNATTFMAVAMLLFILFVGDTVFILNTGTTALGYIANHFFQMCTWLDPFEISQGFPETWTVFYWAWWISFGPFQGMFFAKISRGRTIRQMLLGTLILGPLGTFCFFAIFGNFAMGLEVKGIIDVIPMLANLGAPNTIVQILTHLPLASVAITVVALLCIGYAATTFDSSAYILATASQSVIGEDGEPLRFFRVIWALFLSFIPIAFILIGSPLTPLQTIAVIASLPVSLIIILTAISFIRVVKEDGRI